MIIKLELEIDVPREEVWDLFVNHKNLPQWQMGLKKVSEEKGDGDSQADPNEVFLLHYKIDKNIQVVRETVSEKIEPETFQAAYDHPRIPAHVVMTNTFVEEGDVTIWQVEQYVTFTRLDYRLFGRLLSSILKHQQTHDMLKFKAWAEGQRKSSRPKTKKKSKKAKHNKKR